MKHDFIIYNLQTITRPLFDQKSKKVMWMIFFESFHIYDPFQSEKAILKAKISLSVFLIKAIPFSLFAYFCPFKGKTLQTAQTSLVSSVDG